MHTPLQITVSARSSESTSSVLPLASVKLAGVFERDELRGNKVSRRGLAKLREAPESRSAIQVLPARVTRSRAVLPTVQRWSSSALAPSCCLRCRHQPAVCKGPGEGRLLGCSEDTSSWRRLGVNSLRLASASPVAARRWRLGAGCPSVARGRLEVAVVLGSGSRSGGVRRIGSMFFRVGAERHCWKGRPLLRGRCLDKSCTAARRGERSSFGGHGKGRQIVRASLIRQGDLDEVNPHIPAAVRGRGRRERRPFGPRLRSACPEACSSLVIVLPLLPMYAIHGRLLERAGGRVRGEGGRGRYGAKLSHRAWRPRKQSLRIPQCTLRSCRSISALSDGRPCRRCSPSKTVLQSFGALLASRTCPFARRVSRIPRNGRLYL